MRPKTEIDIEIGLNRVLLDEELSIDEVHELTVNLVKGILGVKETGYVDISIPDYKKNFYKVFIQIN